MKLFYTTERVESSAYLMRVLARCGCEKPTILRTENGKPYLASGGVLFSLTHTEGLTAVAVSDCNVGLDAERRNRRDLTAMRKRLTEKEREEDFFELWTAKEAYVKFLGGTLAHLLPRLVYEGGVLYENGAPVNAFLRSFELEGCRLCVCAETEELVEIVPLD